MADTKRDDNTLLAVVLVLVFFAPIIAWCFAWLITIPIIYFIVNWKINSYVISKGKNPIKKYKWLLPLIFSILLIFGFIFVSIYLTIKLTKMWGWFSTGALSISMSCVAILLWLIDVFALTITIITFVRQKKYTDIANDVVELNKNKQSISKQLRGESWPKTIYKWAIHDKLARKLFKQLSIYLANDYWDQSLDVVLNKDLSVIIPKEALTQHTLILGTTGAGKTNTILHFVKQATKTNKLVVFINGKGDIALKNQLTNLAKQTGYKFLYWNLTGDDVNFNYNIFKDKSDSEIVSILMEIEDYEKKLTLGKDSAYYLKNTRRLYNFYIEVMKLAYLPDHKGESLDLKTLFTYCDYKSVLNLLNHSSYFADSPELQAIKDKKANGDDLTIDEALTLKRYKGKLHQDKYNELFNELQELNQPPYINLWSNAKNTFKLLSFLDRQRKFMTGQGKSISDLIKSKDKIILLFNLDASGLQSEAKEVGRMATMDVKQNFKLLKLCEKPMCFVLDEFGSFATPSIQTALQQGRSSGLETLISCQTLSNLDDVSTAFCKDVLNNTRTKIIHTLSDEEGPQKIAGMFGTIEDIEKTYQTDEGDLSGRGSLRVGDHYIHHPNEIRRIPLKHAIISTFKDGQPLYYKGIIKIDYCGLSDEV